MIDSSDHQIDSIGSPALRETRIRSALDCVKIFFEEWREPDLCSELSCVLRSWYFCSFWSLSGLLFSLSKVPSSGTPCDNGGKGLGKCSTKLCFLSSRRGWRKPAPHEKETTKTRKSRVTQRGSEGPGRESVWAGAGGSQLPHENTKVLSYPRG